MSQKNVLTAKMAYQLTQYADKYYVEKKLSDKEFAEVASIHFNLPITESNVRMARVSLDLPATHTVSIGRPDIEERLRKLEGSILALEIRVGHYFGDSK